MSADISFFTPLANHLWQSSVFVGVIWLLTLALKKNRAAVRYWLWFAASVKFLVPFSALVTLGNQLSWQVGAPVAAIPQWSLAVDNVAEPFATSAPAMPVGAPHGSFSVAAVLVCIWLCGVAAGLIFWLRCWTRMRAIRKKAIPTALRLSIPVLSLDSQIEPGVFGIFRPVLLLPAGIESRLTAEQLDAVIAHEMAHVRRRDNLTAAIHMLVETVFWFFPVVWYLRARLIEERELACDEQVLLRGSEAESYAAGIIEVCKSYTEAPVVCISGISGSDLKRRVVRIVNRTLGESLTPRRKIALTLAALAMISAPLVVGLLNAPARAQASPPTAANTDAPLPSYDVVSVKPNNAPGISSMGGDSPGAFRATNASVNGLIMAAYNVASFQISGEPQWAHSQTFDVEAKADQATTTALAALPFAERRTRGMLMLQSLLADRFKLRVHHESRETSVYALVPARGGLKLPPPQEGSCVEVADSAGPSGEPGGRMPPPSQSASPTVTCGGVGVTLEAAGARMSGRKVPMAQFARVLSRVLGQPVIDRTGFLGFFDLDFDFLPDEATVGLPPPPPGAIPAETAGASIFTAIQQLGLRLESSKGPVDVVVIDHIEKPSPN